jgi:hypothetical protein
MIVQAQAPIKHLNKLTFDRGKIKKHGHITYELKISISWRSMNREVHLLSIKRKQEHEEQ